MTDTVLISTHRLPIAGALRSAFREEGYAVELVPSPDQMEGAEEAVLLILTGVENAEIWAERARREFGLPLFTSFPGPDGLRRGRALGAEESFPVDPDPGEVALLGRRLIERVRLQRLIGIVGESEAIREALERVVQIAPVESTVLITGESGTGKELVARGIHALSHRRHRAFLAVNVAALTDTLLESELFGHEKGAFTGAIDARKGFFELADKGTLFLDEIGEMPLPTQTKLLRVLEQREFLRVGGERSIRSDVRIIAATNQDLRTEVATGRFRRDLYYRLNILGIHLPPLRDRRSDVPILIRHFISEVSDRMGRSFPGVSDEAMEVLTRYGWPGNIRELRNLVESMVVLSPGRPVTPSDLPREITSPVEAQRLLPVLARGETPESVDERLPAGRRPELEFVFRTLVDLRVDMDQLRQEFESFREESGEGAILLGGALSEMEVGLARRSLPGGGYPFTDSPEGPFVDRSGRSSDDEEEALFSRPPDGEEVGGVVFRPGMTMETLEHEAIRAVLEEFEGNRRKAAESLGIGERTLYRKIQKYGIEL